MPTYRTALMAAVPRGWHFKESLTLLAPDGQANVIISSEPLSGGADAAGYARSQGGLLAREFAGYREHSFEPVVMFGRYEGYLREFTWSPPDGVAVTQVQTYCVIERRGYTATATTPATLFAQRRAGLRETLLSARIGG